MTNQTSGKSEEYHKHWEEDLKAARGIFGYPLIIGCILSFWIVVGVSWLVDASF